jgi:hypothetical protein
MFDASALAPGQVDLSHELRDRHLPRDKFAGPPNAPADNQGMRQIGFLIAALVVALSPHIACADAFSWSDTTGRPVGAGRVRVVGPPAADLRSDYPLGRREIADWTASADSPRMRDGLCIVSDSVGGPVAEGYFTHGRRLGGWVTWGASRVRQEWWSGGASPDSVTADQPDVSVLLLDVHAPWSGRGHKEAGGSEIDCFWSQAPAGPDSTEISWSEYSLIYQSATRVFHVPRGAGILLVRRAGLFCPDFEGVLGRWYFRDIGTEHRGRRQYR